VNAVREGVSCSAWLDPLRRTSTDVVEIWLSRYKQVHEKDRVYDNIHTQVTAAEQTVDGECTVDRNRNMPSKAWPAKVEHDEKRVSEDDGDSNNPIPLVPEDHPQRQRDDGGPKYKRQGIPIFAQQPHSRRSNETELSYRWRKRASSASITVS